MENNDNEAKKYDCSRGCTVERRDDGELNCRYRPGCCKMEVYDWLPGVAQEQYKDFFEVRFKNTRKGIYFNASGQSIKAGDLVVVEAATGHDLGIVTLEGAVVARQMKCRRLDPASGDYKKIYRKAKVYDLEKWQEAIDREQDTMIRSRQIAAELGLEMKIGDVEFQGDGTKAIFYYIADGRVDFRQLIKVFADEFHIRIEMKQIGARQEAGLIGGLGICGRELCCSNYISTFQSISTSAARLQDLSLNPQKLAGQCGKLKCCLNYETASYMDAQSRIPKVANPLEFQDGLAYLMKTDILREVMYFSYDKFSQANMFPLSAIEVREIQKMNREGIRPESLKSEPEPVAPEFVTAVGDDSITRFDNIGRRRKSRGGRGGNGGPNRNGGQNRNERSNSQDGNDRNRDGGRDDNRRGGQRNGDRNRNRGGQEQNQNRNSGRNQGQNPNKGQNGNGKGQAPQVQGE